MLQIFAPGEGFCNIDLEQVDASFHKQDKDPPGRPCQSDKASREAPSQQGSASQEVPNSEILSSILVILVEGRRRPTPGSGGGKNMGTTTEDCCVVLAGHACFARAGLYGGLSRHAQCAQQGRAC